MDPNANLREQSTLLECPASADRRRLAELRRALADWTARGGFSPDWRAYPETAAAYRAWARRAAKFQDLAR